MALDLVRSYESVFKQFREAISEIKHIDPCNWKQRFRIDFLNLFNDLSSSIDSIRDQKLQEINDIFAQINVSEVNQGLNELQISEDAAKEHQIVLNKLFDKNQFSTLTKR